MQFLNKESQHNRDHQNMSGVRQSGFSLIELMVGLVIGLFATLAIMQVFGVFEGQKRSTSGNADAQTNGSVALYNVQREVKLAGYGLPLFDQLEMPLTCNTTLHTKASTAAHPYTAINIVTPIIIQDGGAGAGASDTVTVHYGTTNRAGVPNKVTAIATTAGNPIDIGNNMNCNNNDIVIAISGNNCVVQEVTPPPPFPNAIDLPPPFPIPAIPRTNNTQITLHSNTGIVAGSMLSCVGGWNTIVFAINANNQLTRNGIPMVDGIVNIQAQYGISATYQSNQITQWVNATGAWAAPTAANRNRIKAVRVAVVARNGLLEKLPAVSTACSSIIAANPTGVCAWDATSASPTIASTAPIVNLSNTPQWNQYRYKVYESIIPLRNVVWTKDRLL